MIRKGLSITGFVAAIGLIFGLVGCSDNPVAPMKTSVESGQRDFTENLPTAEMEIYGRVASTDNSSRSLILNGQTWAITVSASAEIVSKSSGDEMPIDFSQIQLGDSVEVRGNPSGTNFTANRVRVRPLEHGPESEFGGRVTSIDTALNQIQLVGDSRLIFVSGNAELVQRTEDADVIITFDQIMPGDSVEIKAFSQPDGSLLAVRVRVRLDQAGEDFRSEVEFKDSILAIDYAQGIITTRTCWQIITDSLTFIFGSHETGDGSSDGAARRGVGDDWSDSTRSRLALTDLKVGDFIEVHGNPLPSGAIYAVAIELEDALMDNRAEIEFKDVIASIDQLNRTVTFIGESRTGVVDWMADLAGLNNEPMTLEAFTPGMLVEVKAFVSSNGLLSIVRMHRDNNL